MSNSDNGQVGTAGTMQAEIYEKLGRFLSFRQAKRLEKNLPLMSEAVAELRTHLNAPALSLIDIRQTYKIAVAPILTPEEKRLLIISVYCDIHQHPQWSYMGNIFWIERKLDQVIAAKKAAAAMKMNAVTEKRDQAADIRQAA